MEFRGFFRKVFPARNSFGFFGINLPLEAIVWTWSHSRKALDRSLWGPGQPNDGNDAFPLAALLQDSDYYIYDVGHNSDHTYTKFALCQIKL